MSVNATLTGTETRPVEKMLSKRQVGYDPVGDDVFASCPEHDVFEEEQALLYP